MEKVETLLGLLDSENPAQIIEDDGTQKPKVADLITGLAIESERLNRTSVPEEINYHLNSFRYIDHYHCTKPQG